MGESLFSGFSVVIFFIHFRNTDGTWLVDNFVEPTLDYPGKEHADCRLFTRVFSFNRGSGCSNSCSGHAFFEVQPCLLVLTAVLRMHRLKATRRSLMSPTSSLQRKPKTTKVHYTNGSINRGGETWS
ncbi:hypothetical protein P153DRAFT_142900 [Dothidotthia symphoricarpi CBS 119687]|uniref:Uncharacterized protein n=1 Tax=Dothidotthia symphoricarpi CBS 119687 TaxID=1392245 RepID=A0A6A5ZYS4_9PLEO|nr:uncharacterized protein P153DRAFT_142900 [Dothidotthia symphoricarpi CBS 119687]KAF2124023.1 hypothetical protein P153DRAFT_142900 [Dothidotthia symphoricarpi CBS 119687]